MAKPTAPKAQVLRDGVLMLFGPVGDDFFGGFTAANVVEDLHSLSDEDRDPIRVLLNSPGGDVFEGLAIHNELATHPSEVHVTIPGVAASAASMIAMAADRVLMHPQAHMMIHDPWLARAGNAEELRRAADLLDRFGTSLANIYAERSGLSEDQVREMMSADGGDGTWMTAEEAVEMGFADEVVSEDEIEESEQAAAFAGLDVTGLPNVPDRVAAMIRKGRAKMPKTKAPRAGARGGGLIADAIAARAEAEDITLEEAREEAGSAAGISASTLAQIENGEIDCPPLDRLEGLASLSWMPSESALVSAFEGDGCSYGDDDDAENADDDDDNNAQARSRRMTKTLQAQIDEAVQAAIDAQNKAEQKRIEQVRSLAKKYELGDAWSLQHIQGQTSPEDVRAAVADALFRGQKNGPSPIPPGVGVSADESDKRREGLVDWLVVKSGNARLIEKHTGTRPDPGEFRGMRLLDIARECVEARGESVRGMSPMQIARRALVRGPRAENAGLGTTSDFSVLMENVLHKMLRAAYETAPDQWSAVAATGSVSDFRAHPRYRLGSLANLPDKLESGEFRQLHFPDAEKESIQADTKGAIVGLSRQAIVNDDLDGFARMVTMLGRAAARSIEVDLFALLELNAGLGPNMNDGNPLFHARTDADNIDTTVGTPNVARLESARVKMAQIKDPDGNDFLNLRPDVWVGPIGLGADVRTAINSEFDFDAETSGNTGKFMKPNVVRDLLSTIVDTPRLSGTRWYAFADPAIAPVLEVVFLDGQEGPVIEIEEGFDYDGTRWRVRHDYGVGATDFRGAVTNAGA